ncbi:hypothetical protein NUU61_005620 [Penicillium alfredii]|uniref:Uncharacterized protein n=1 Tax=Penicillium alfredii TaxID=1506179 RepID=A0A9W9F9W7_9EURO|nr:uncharacterized protein NUU61_005620 [Penicillium alfredii]KAJ5096264.1 hypothetical protein NUU61_005620 [Penicillium alfredii]
MASPLARQKRNRVSDAAEKPRSTEDRVKRRRFSETSEAQKIEPVKPVSAEGVSNSNVQVQDVSRCSTLAPWSFSRPLAGRYSNLDPILTADEAYLFVGLETAVQVFATSTSRLSRTLQMETGQKVVGYKLCPADSENIYIFTSGSVTKWHWNSGKRLSRWETSCTTLSADLASMESGAEFTTLFFSIELQNGGKRQIVINTSGDKKLQSVTALHTNKRIHDLKVIQGGRIIIASDGQHILLGSTASAELENLETVQYSWREATLPVSTTCFDLRESAPAARSKTPDTRDSESIDLVVGESGGAILIYQDILASLFGKQNSDKKPSPRKLHWHRGPVNSVRWSQDGNYIISGGQESVMVLWQLDTGRKQFLPHLSSPICNIVVSPQGNSYVVKLADNSTMILSARELQPSTTITGLQVCPEVASRLDPFLNAPHGVVATLHPQRPEQLLIAVPAFHQINQHGPQAANSAVLQTFDIRADAHISRQALARTNATTLSVSPEGSLIVAPDIKHMGIVQDATWLATVDSWSSPSQDTEALDRHIPSLNSPSVRSEVFLKFWKWNASSDIWELVTRIDGPHFTNNRHAAVLSLVSRPSAHEFATLGADKSLRFWGPTARYRSGLKAPDQPELQLDTWKCRSSLDLTGCLDNPQASPLDTACMAFSEDGSVLAVCLPSGSGANDGLVLLVDARTSTVHYRRTGVFPGAPSSVDFLGRHLIVASTQSVAVWDTVDDVVKTIQLSEPAGSAGTGSFQLVAANPKTKSFAIATRAPEGGSSTSQKKRHKRTRFHIKIYDVPSFELVFSDSLRSCPLALLSDAYSGDYIIVDGTASVQRLGCLDKVSQKGVQSREVTGHLQSGLASLFNRGHVGISSQAGDEESLSPQTKGLASVFGDSPSFSLPSLGVLFRNVVQTLGAH